jgi:hypothetical protein
VAPRKASGERQVLLDQLPPYVRIQHSIQHHVSMGIREASWTRRGGLVKKSLHR